MASSSTDDDDGEWPLRWLFRIAIGFFLAGLLGAALLVLIAGWIVARAQDCSLGAYGCGHAENHEKYQGWNERPMLRDGHPTKDGSCCNGQDCRPVRADPQPDGSWRIWIPEWRVWVPVPRDAVGVADRFHDGRSHACTSTVDPDVPGYLAIYCFSPTGSKG